MTKCQPQVPVPSTIISVDYYTKLNKDDAFSQSAGLLSNTMRAKSLTMTMKDEMLL